MTCSNQQMYYMLIERSAQNKLYYDTVFLIFWIKRRKERKKTLSFVLFFVHPNNTCSIRREFWVLKGLHTRIHSVCSSPTLLKYGKYYKTSPITIHFTMHWVLFFAFLQSSQTRHDIQMSWSHKTFSFPCAARNFCLLTTWHKTRWQVIAGTTQVPAAALRKIPQTCHNYDFRGKHLQCWDVIAHAARINRSAGIWSRPQLQADGRCV